jgi:hypothetical protein
VGQKFSKKWVNFQSKNSNGMSYKAVDNGGSSVVISKHMKIDKTLEAELIKTEILIKILK